MMQTTLTIIMIFLGSFLMSRCSRIEDDTVATKDNSLPIINLGQVKNKVVDLPLSTLVDNIKIIPLETNSDILIGPDPKAIDAGEFLIIFSEPSLYLFTKDGKFIDEIGSVGRGPGEHFSPAMFNTKYYESDSTIMVLWLFENPQLFKAKGQFKGELNTQFAQTPVGRLSDSIWFNAGSWAGARNEPRDSIILTFFDKSGRIIKTIPRQDYPNREGYSPNHGSISLGLYFPEIFVNHKDNLVIFHMPGNDTIYDISSMILRPYAVIDPGKYKIPYNKVVDMEQMNGKAQFSILKETKNNIIFRKMNSSSIRNNYGEDAVSYIEDPFQLVIYNKNSGKAKTVRIVDDLLGLLTDEFLVSRKMMKWILYSSHVNWDSKNPVVISQSYDILNRLTSNDLIKGIKELNDLKESSNPVVFELELKDEIIIE